MKLMCPNDIYPKISRKTTIWEYTVIAIAKILPAHQKIPVINFSDISKSICKAIIKVTEIRGHGKIKLKIV